MSIKTSSKTSFDDGLTAKTPCENLKSHMISFLAKNNDGAWAEDLQYIFTRGKISDQIIECSMSAGLSVGSLKKRGKELFKLIKDSGGSMKLGQVYDLLARALGYVSYSRAFELRGCDDFVPNLWLPDLIRGEQFLNLDSFSAWPSQKVSEEFSRRKAFNLKRAATGKEIILMSKRKRRLEWLQSSWLLKANEVQTSLAGDECT